MKNEEFRAFLAGNMEPMQRRVDEINEVFLKEVKKYRELKGDPDYATSGKLFMATEAKKIGLADSIGGLQFAIKRLRANINRRNNAA